MSAHQLVRYSHEHHWSYNDWVRWRAWVDPQFRADLLRLAAWYSAHSYPSGQCGGDLPPCYVMARESGGSLTARNPRSSAAGKWQFLASTWDGYGGYASAADAPERVQDDKARALWAGGRGCAHWSAC